MLTDWYVPVFNPQASSFSFFFNFITHFATFVQQEDSILLWKSIVSNPLLARTNLVLFLNKIDRFKEKLPVSPMKNYFPDYEGGQDYAAACEYILNRFVS